MNCLFCNIANGLHQNNIVYEADDVIAFHDINPQAPVHTLFIPKKHITTVNDIDQKDINIAGKLILAAAEYAKQISVASDGYRLVMNCNQHGGQSVYHVHLHFLAGRAMHWPPG